MTEPNAADRKWVREREKAAKLADASRAEVITSIMSTEAGRRFFWDKLASAGIFLTTFSTDPIQMAFNEGQRNQGLLLLNDIIQWCPDQFILAMREFNGRRTSDNATNANGNSGQRTSGTDPDWGDQEPAGDSADGDPGAEAA